MLSSRRVSVVLSPVFSQSFRAVKSPSVSFSVSSVVRKDPVRPRKNGDKGPERNYIRKINKKLNKTEKELSVNTESLLGSLQGKTGEERRPEVISGQDEEAPVIRGNEHNYNDSRRPYSGPMRRERNVSMEDGRFYSAADVGLDSLLKGITDLDSNAKPEEQSSETDLKGLLSDIKLEVDGKEMFDKEISNSGIPIPKELSWDPAAGPRLGLFNIPPPGVEVMPPGKPTYQQMESQRKIAQLNLLKPWCHYDEVPTYPRQFPIDNENYDQGAEAKVGFEEHVLLDHLLADFPKKGPVRHFMELVVTGLSRNPNYTAAEKKSFVAWYKNYFEQFSVEELQSIKSVKQQ